MSIDWTKQTPGYPYKDKDDKYYVNVEIAQDPNNPLVLAGTGNADDDNAIKIGAAFLLDYFGVSDPDAGSDIAEIKAGPIISGRPGGSAYYLIGFLESYDVKESANADLGYLMPTNLAVQDGFLPITFKNYNSFAKSMQVLALKLEEYAEQMEKDNPEGLVYAGPRNLGYGNFDFRQEAKNLRDFYTIILDLFRLNEMNADVTPFQFFIRQLNQNEALGASPETSLYVIEDVGKSEIGISTAQTTVEDRFIRLRGQKTFFGGLSDSVTDLSGNPVSYESKGPLNYHRTIHFILTLDAITDTILSGYDPGEVANMKVGAGCKLPTLATTEDPLPVGSFVNLYARPMPHLGLDLSNPIKTFDIIKKDQTSLKTKKEKELVKDFSVEPALQFAVNERNTKVNEYFGDIAFQSLPRSPGDIRKITTIDDAYAYVLNQIDIQTLVSELLACMKMDFSINDLIDKACDTLLKRVFDDPNQLQKLIDFMESGDSALSLAWGRTELPEEIAFADDIGPSIHSLTQALKSSLSAQVDTGSPAMDTFFSGDIEGAFIGDERTTKRFICEVLIVGPFVGLIALINLIKSLRSGDDPPKKASIPPFKKCEPTINFKDDFPILDQLKQALIDAAFQKAEELLEEFILTPLRELLWNIATYCQDKSDGIYGELDPGNYPTPREAINESFGNVPDDFDKDKFLSDLFASLTPNELCSLYKGEASYDLLSYVLKYFMTFGDGELKAINTVEKVASWWKKLGESADLSICIEVELGSDEEARQPIVDLCGDDPSLREEMLARALALRGLEPGEIDEQLAAVRDINDGIAESLLQLLSAPSGPGDVEIDMTSEIADSLKNTVGSAVETMLADLEITFVTDLSAVMPILLSRQLNLFGYLAQEVDNSVNVEEWPGLFSPQSPDEGSSYHYYALPVSSMVETISEAAQTSLAFQNLDKTLQAEQIVEDIQFLKDLLDPGNHRYEYFHNTSSHSKAYQWPQWSPMEKYLREGKKGFGKGMRWNEPPTNEDDQKILKRIYFRWHNFLWNFRKKYDGYYGGNIENLESSIDGTSGIAMVKSFFQDCFGIESNNISDQEYFSILGFSHPDSGASTDVDWQSKPWSSHILSIGSAYNWITEGNKQSTWWGLKHGYSTTEYKESSCFLGMGDCGISVIKRGCVFDNTGNNSTNAFSFTDASMNGNTVMNDSPTCWHSFWFKIFMTGFAPEGNIERIQIILNWYEHGIIPTQGEADLFKLYKWKDKNIKGEKDNPGGGVSTGYTIPPSSITSEVYEDIEIPAPVVNEAKTKEVRYQLLPTAGNSYTKAYSLVLHKYGLQNKDIFSYKSDSEPISSAISGYIKTLEEKASVSLNTDRPKQPQAFAFLIDDELGAPIGADPFDGKFGFEESDGYLKAVRNVLVTRRHAEYNLYGHIFRNLMGDLSKEFESSLDQLVINIEKGIVKNLHFFHEDSNIFDLEGIKTTIIENFARDISKAEFEDAASAPKLTNYLVDFPSAAAIRILIKLIVIETIIKTIATFVVIKPSSNFFGSSMMTAYIKNIIETRLVSLNIVLPEDLGDLDLGGFISETAQDVGNVIRNSLSKMVGFTQQTLSNFSSNVIEPPVIPIAKISSLTKKTNPRYVSGGKMHTSFGFADTAEPGDLVAKYDSNWSRWWATLWTEPRFTSAFENASHDNSQTEKSYLTGLDFKVRPGFVIEKYVEYTIHNETFLRYNISNYINNNTVFNLSPQSDAITKFIKKVKSLPVELIGRTELWGGFGPIPLNILDFERRFFTGEDALFNEIIDMPKAYSGQPPYKLALSKIYAGDASATTGLNKFFSDIKIGYRLCYVFPQDHPNKSWWKRPLSGPGASFWGRFKEQNLHDPKHWSPNTSPTSPEQSKAFLDMKVQKAFFMREIPAGYKDFLEPEDLATSTFTDAQIDTNAWSSFPEIFVLPLCDTKTTLMSTTSGTEIDTTLDDIKEFYDSSAVTDMAVENLKETKQYQALFNYIFPVEDIITLMTIRNVLGFEEVLYGFEEIGQGKCFDESLFNLTQDSVKFLISWAYTLKKHDNPYEAAFDQAQTKNTVDKFKKMMKKNLGLSAENLNTCTQGSKFDAVSDYLAQNTPLLSLDEES